jgi:hypothetical protein
VSSCTATARGTSGPWTRTGTSRCTRGRSTFGVFWARPTTSCIGSNYPFTPKSNAHLKPGQFWPVPLSDGRFGCGRVLGTEREPGYGARTWFLGGLLDWVGVEPPTAESIAGAGLLEFGHAHVDAISENGPILGERPPEADNLTVPAPDTVMSYWGGGYPKLRVERRFIACDPPPKAERRFLGSPLTDEMLAPSATGRGIVQFSDAYTDDEYQRLAAWLENYPEMTLRVYSSRDIRDLEFLRFFPSLQNFAADTLFFFESADGLRHVPESLQGLAWARCDGRSTSRSSRGSRRCAGSISRSTTRESRRSLNSRASTT